MIETDLQGFWCLSCGDHFWVQSKRAGQPLRCPFCGKSGLSFHVSEGACAERERWKVLLVGGQEVIFEESVRPLLLGQDLNVYGPDGNTLLGRFPREKVLGIYCSEGRGTPASIGQREVKKEGANVQNDET